MRHEVPPPADQEASANGIGQPVRRKEDERLVIGAGRYSDDVSFPGQLYAVMAHSPHAYARITKIFVVL